MTPLLQTIAALILGILFILFLAALGYLLEKIANKGESVDCESREELEAEAILQDPYPQFPND